MVLRPLLAEDEGPVEQALRLELQGAGLAAHVVLDGGAEERVLHRGGVLGQRPLVLRTLLQLVRVRLMREGQTVSTV